MIDFRDLNPYPAIEVAPPDQAMMRRRSAQKTEMKNVILTSGILASFFLTGCGSEAPIAQGKAKSGMVWESPQSLGRSSRGSPIDRSSHVAVFPTLIVITTESGSKQIVPIDYVTELEIE